MISRLKDSASAKGILFSFVFLLWFGTGLVKAQSGCPAPFTTMKQKKVTNININGVIHGYLEYLPDEYNSTNWKTYPVIIYIHGVNETGNGSESELCKIIYEWNWEPPTQIEKNLFPYSVKDQNGTVYKYIVISPQLLYFGDPSGTINSFIDHLVNKYRIDPARIYLTGVSAGADYINSYAGASVANAKRVAAITPVALCSGINQTQASNIANGNLNVWTFKCSLDSSCGNPNVGDREKALINGIKDSLAWSSTFPTNGWNCNIPYHNIWGNAYDTTFNDSIYGRRVNQYEWMIQYRNDVVNSPTPVMLENFVARYADDKVYLNWKTSAEENSDHFTIERADARQQYTPIANIAAQGSSSVAVSYQWVDNQPLKNLNFYRLSQTDKDGKKQYFPIKKVLNTSRWDKAVVVSPNPFAGNLNIYLNVPGKQKITILLTDMSGRTLKTLSGVYDEGTAEINLPTHDLPRGMYFLQTRGAGFSEIQKVVKQ